MASQRNGTLYVGMTNNLQTRAHQHKNNLIDGFTKENSVHMLVYFEQTNDVNSALLREKQIKHWKRAWKLRLIEESNPNWKDLAEDF